MEKETEEDQTPQRSKHSKQYTGMTIEHLPNVMKNRSF